MASQLPTLLYLHGFNSSPASKKARQLVHACEQLGVAGQLRVPALHHHPREAIAQCEQAIAELGAPLLIGSSLGGYYATHLAEHHGLKALLINPAVLPHTRFDGYLGPQQNLYSGETWQLTLEHIQALAALEVPAPQTRGASRCGCRPLTRPSTTARPRPGTGPARCASSPVATTATRALPLSCPRCSPSPALIPACGATTIFPIFDELESPWPLTTPTPLKSFPASIRCASARACTRTPPAPTTWPRKSSTTASTRRWPGMRRACR